MAGTTIRWGGGVLRRAGVVLTGGESVLTGAEIESESVLYRDMETHPPDR